MWWVWVIIFALLVVLGFEIRNKDLIDHVIELEDKVSRLRDEIGKLREELQKKG